MNRGTTTKIDQERLKLRSKQLARVVEVRIFSQKHAAVNSQLTLLLLNDGQDTPAMNFSSILENLLGDDAIKPMICVAVSCGADRMQEYGVASKKDFLGRGGKGKAYTKFILKELIPFLKKKLGVTQFAETAFAGFSLGGLSALDIVWNHPDVFSKVGVFSGALWWRSMGQDNPRYDDNKHRIMHRQIQKSDHKPGLKFFFECGQLDETSDRNNNGIIDSIEDTLDLINELYAKGYQTEDVHYLELPNGRHDVDTWGKAMPAFLKWGWGK